MKQMAAMALLKGIKKSENYSNKKMFATNSSVNDLYSKNVKRCSNIFCVWKSKKSKKKKSTRICRNFIFSAMPWTQAKHTNKLFTLFRKIDASKSDATSQKGHEDNNNNKMPSQYLVLSLDDMRSIWSTTTVCDVRKMCMYFYVYIVFAVSAAASNMQGVYDTK